MLERRESPFLVSAHQAAVTGNVGREDGSQSSFDPRLGHKGRPALPVCELSLWLGTGCVYPGNNIRFGSKADICAATRHVRFTPNSDRKSGHAAKVMSALPPKADMCG